MAKTGRPSTYTEEIADLICNRIASGESLNSICKEADTPAQSTVFKWLAENAAFSEKYARAREAQADTLFDEMLEIADDASNDWMERKGDDGENIGWQLNGEHVQRSKLRLEARKWMAGKLRPKKYGDRLDLNHSGSIDTMSEKDVDARLAVLLRKAGIASIDGAEGEDPAAGEA